MRKPVRAVIAEDAPLLRQAISLVLQDGGIEVVAELADITTIGATIAAHRPDVIILDLRMPPTRHREGLQAAQQIKQFDASIGVVLLSQHIDVEVANQLFATTSVPTGVGYLLKERTGSLGTFLDAVTTVASGGCVMDPEIVSLLLQRRTGLAPLARLTPKEHQVLALMAQGLSNLAIGNRLSMSERTVESHVGRVLTHLDLPISPDTHRRVQAVLRYLAATQTDYYGHNWTGAN